MSKNKPKQIRGIQFPQSKHKQVECTKHMNRHDGGGCYCGTAASCGRGLRTEGLDCPELCLVFSRSAGSCAEGSECSSDPVPSEHAVQVLLGALLVRGGVHGAVLGVVVPEDGHDVVVAEVDRLVHRCVPPPVSGDRVDLTGLQ